jgi:Na+-transporting methylmalonyl-CoA/oxaloacetate decarboxylase gamma subunit
MFAQIQRTHLPKEWTIMIGARNRKILLGLGVMAGFAQACAGVAMYLAGVYFAPWSMGVSLLVLLLCIVVGTRWYTAHCLNGEITYVQALGVGIVIAVSTGLVYAIYNMISISWFYPNFLDDMVRARMAQASAHQPSAESFATLRSQVTAPAIAISNCIRLSVIGSVLSLVSALFLKRTK